MDLTSGAIAGIAIAAAIVLYCLVRPLMVLACRPALPLSGRHVFITGGSEGLGLSLAHRFAAAGSLVTILSRSEAKLAAAKAAILATYPSAAVHTISADVTDGSAIASAVHSATEHHGEIFVAVACAGSATTGRFLELTLQQHQAQMQLNFFGALHLAKAVAPGMARARQGHIVLISSGLALTGYVGYSAYAPTKWAIRGLGEVLRNELLAYNIKVYNAFPPTMDTPGYQVENITKPPETKAIEAGEPLHNCNVSADAIMTSLRNGEFNMGCGDFGVGMLIRSSAGMSPRSHYLLDAIMGPILVLVGLIYRRGWDAEVTKPAYQQALLGQQQQA